ncbi:MAG: NAD(P)-dependent oxidoreductase [Abitibacteriaceae bacterium]|nr:NAD(P)-dependent oxidoreductase [Abditibacteriaceae bacterium]
MKVLITGNKGRIGKVVESVLQASSCKTVGFDRASGHNVLDPQQVRAAMEGCHAVVHLAAHLGGGGAKSDDVMATNLLGTWHILTAAQVAGVQRVVCFSSVQAMGVFAGHRKPDFLPIDETHPCYPTIPYAISKRLGEEACRYFTLSSGITTICLRPPAVFSASAYDYIKAKRAENPDFEWHPYWEYGAFLDVRDAATAVQCALHCPDPGHVELLLCADDISSSSGTSRELARALLPDVEWRGGPEYDAEPYKALVRNDQAKRILGWAPQYRWRA